MTDGGSSNGLTVKELVLRLEGKFDAFVVAHAAQHAGEQQQHIDLAVRAAGHWASADAHGNTYARLAAMEAVIAAQGASPEATQGGQSLVRRIGEVAKRVDDHQDALQRQAGAFRALTWAVGSVGAVSIILGALGAIVGLGVTP